MILHLVALVALLALVVALIILVATGVLGLVVIVAIDIANNRCMVARTHATSGVITTRCTGNAGLLARNTIPIAG